MATALPEWYREQRRKWTAVADSWHEGEPPAVPSPDDLTAFCEFVLRAGGGSRPRVVVMGATVALRRAILTDPRLSHAQVTTVDFSPEMLEVTTRALATTADLSRETRVVGDWRSLRSHVPLSADAIVADKSFDNIAFSDWPAVFRSCGAVLREHGRLVLHVGLTDASYECFNPAECLDTWASRLDAGRCTLGDAAAGYWEDLLTGSAYVGDSSRHELSVGKFNGSLRTLEARHSSGSTQATILIEFNRRFGDSNKSRWTAFKLDDVHEQACAWFSAGDLSYSHDYAAARLQPVVELIRRPPFPETES